MASTDSLKIILEAIDNASLQIKGVQNSVESLSKSTKESTDKISGSFSNATNSLVKYVAGFASIAVVTSFLKSSVAEAMQAEAVQAKLQHQIEAAGVSWATYGGQIDSVIQKVSDYAIVQDEQVKAALQRLVLVTNDVTGSMNNLQLTVDLATARGIDMETAAMLVGKAMAGNLDVVGRFIPEIYDLNESLGKNATSAEKSAAALKLLHERVEGVAGAIPDNVRMVKEFQKTWLDFKETMGMYVLPVVAMALDSMTMYLKDFLSYGLADFKNVIVSTVKDIYNAIKLWLVDKFWDVVNSITAPIKGIIDKFIWLKDVLVGHSIIPDMVADIGVYMREGLEQNMLNPAKEIADEVLQTMDMVARGVGDAFARAIVYGESLAEGLKNAFKSAVASIISGLIQIGVQQLLSLIIGKMVLLKKTASEMASYAATTYAGAFSSQASIPIIGPFIAPGIAAAAVAAMLAGAKAAAVAGAIAGTTIASYREGGIVTSPTVALIGEAGPEAVVPLKKKGKIGGGGGLVINFSGPILGDSQQARVFALEVDKALYDLKIKGLSLALT
ncbi:MAG: hypothetical protein QME32_00315 [Endomicrobiia bacterium]|nr:hypothetical protein [Endomicrobiia bacterium]